MFNGTITSNRERSVSGILMTASLFQSKPLPLRTGFLSKPSPVTVKTMSHNNKRKKVKKHT